MSQASLLPSVIEALLDDALVIAVDVRDAVLENTAVGVKDLYSSNTIAELVMRVMYTTQYLVKLHRIFSEGGSEAVQDLAQRLTIPMVEPYRGIETDTRTLRDLIDRQEAIERRYAWLHQIICDGSGAARIRDQDWRAPGKSH